MLGDTLGERCSELEDRGGSRLPRGCDLGCESVERCLCGLRYRFEVGAGTLGVTGVASCRPICGSLKSGERDRGMSK
jgi:hypothetical protein